MDGNHPNKNSMMYLWCQSRQENRIRLPSNYLTKTVILSLVHPINSPSYLALSVDGGAPIPYNIGMEVFDQKKGLIFQSFIGLEKDRKLPLTGQTKDELFTTGELRPGMEEDKMMVPIYFAERDAHGSRSIINVFGYTIEINGMDVEKLVPANSLAEFTMKINISQEMTLEVDFPRLDMDVITKTVAFTAKATVQKEQIDTLFEEIQKGINKLNNSPETVPQLGDFRSKLSFYNI